MHLGGQEAMLLLEGPGKVAGVGVATISGDIHSQPAGCSTLITKVSDGADTE